MPHPIADVDYKSVGSPVRTAPVPSVRRQPDAKAVEELLGLFARALQQLHTYPQGSPLCVTAVGACQQALAALSARDRVTFRVTPTEILVDDVPIGTSSPFGRELARRLHKASAASVTIDRSASTREIARFCESVVRCSERGWAGATLGELLAEHGIERIAVDMAQKPEVLDVSPLSDTAAEDLVRERQRFDAQLAKGGSVDHLYPPQKGWMRLDPSTTLPSVSLLELAVLADDPAALASMLLRLTDGASDESRESALETKYSDVARLISALDPRAARRMFGRLARAVLDLPPDARQALLRRAVLPGLLDGRVDGWILRDFPNVDLAESLCLLLDLETAAPELLATALSRLDLPAERREVVVPLLEDHLNARETAALEADRRSTLVRHARELVKVNGAASKSFVDFSAFDLSMDEDSSASLMEMRETLPSSDLALDQLTCLWHLICLEPSPEAVARFLRRSFAILATLENGSRGDEIPMWIGRYRGLADTLRAPRPDVSAIIGASLDGFCTPERAAWIVDLSLAGENGRQAADALIEALGPIVVAPLVAVLDRDSASAARTVSAGAAERSRGAVQLLLAHARSLAPAVAALTEHSPPAVCRSLMRVLGAAGAGYEDAVARYVASPDEEVGREALRSLARIGTAKAAARVILEITKQRGALSLAAEETLWHFPLPEARRCTRELLGRREFAIDHPKAAERLLDRAVRAGADDLGPVLASLAPMRFRLWNPALARVARKAHQMLQGIPARERAAR